MKLFRFLRPYRVLIVFVMGLTFLQSLSQLYLPTLMANLVDIGIVKKNILYIVQVGGVMLLVSGGVVGFSIVANFYSSRIAMAFGKMIRSEIFAHVEGLSLQQFNQIGTASLVTRTTNDVMQIQQVLTMVLRLIITAPMMFFVGIILAVSIDAKLSTIIIAVIPILTVAILLTARKGMPFFKGLRKKLDQLSLLLREKLNGIRVIRSFNRVEYEKERFDEANTDYMDTSIKVNRLMAVLTPIMMLVLNFSMIALIWFGSIRISSGDLQVGDLMAIIQYTLQIMYSLVAVSMMFIIIPRASVSAGRVNEVLAMVFELNDEENKQMAEGQGDIEFRDVSFGFQGAEESVLSHVSFRAKSGEITAIIGGTGAGKSTLISLIPRLYDTDNGSIFINGVCVRDMSKEDLRAKIGFVPQKASLFTGTVADNIRYGKETATDQEVVEAAGRAQASDFIARMKEGFQSVITRGGTNLSGGQRQRIAIARAFVRNPGIYVLDDSFSALDSKTDARLRAALKKEPAQSTVLLVTQKISTAMEADQIVVLDQGKVAGIGTHQELMETCGVYQGMVNSQFSEEETA